MTLTTVKPGLHAAGDLPMHPILKHPLTGLPLQALGYRRNGQAIWPIIGGSGDDDPKPPDPKPVDPPVDPKPGDPAKDDDKPLGPAGEKALQAERDARKALEKQVAELSPLKKLVEALAGGKQPDDKTAIEALQAKFADQEKAIAEERQARWRAEVAAEKKLKPEQAKRLVGSTKEELLADADDLLSAFPAKDDDEADAGKAGKKQPRPDPAQGARSGEKASSLDGGRSLYAERHKKKQATSTST